MNQHESTIWYNGIRGTLKRNKKTKNKQSSRVLAVFEDGTEREVNLAELTQQADGSWLLGDAAEESEQHVIPVVREVVHVQKRHVDTGGVRVQKVVHEREEFIEQQLAREDVRVERVTKRQYVPEGQSVAPYQDGDTWVIPVVEEVVVLQKRLMLIEEVRITKQSQTRLHVEPITVQREEVIITPIEPAELPPE